MKASFAIVLKTGTQTMRGEAATRPTLGGRFRNGN